MFVCCGVRFCWFFFYCIQCVSILAHGQIKLIKEWNKNGYVRKRFFSWNVMTFQIDGFWTTKSNSIALKLLTLPTFLILHTHTHTPLVLYQSIVNEQQNDHDCWRNETKRNEWTQEEKNTHVHILSYFCIGPHIFVRHY